MAESQAFSVLDERLFDDPSQLSQLLQQRASSDKTVHFTTSTESSRSAIVASVSVSTFAVLPQPDRAGAEQQPSVVPTHNDSAPAPSPRRVNTTARNVKPTLPTHHSAPTSTGFVKEMAVAPRMHRSFAGMDAPGDTQPDSQIYKEWTSGVHPPGEVAVFRKTTSPKSLFVEHADVDEGDSPTDKFDMVDSSQEHHSPTVTSPTVMHDEDDSMSMFPPGGYAATSPLKFETPAMAGRKRDSSGQMLSSAMRTDTTPGTVISTSAFPGFAIGGMAPMSLTQAWQNTQAPTSPAPVAPAEDVAFTRPSPNFVHARHSSPALALSSPIKANRDETPRTDPVLRSSSEPRAEYVSMKESQERRKRTPGEQQVQTSEQDSWDQPSAAQARIQKRRLKQDRERQAAMLLAHVSAPAALSPAPHKKRTTKTEFFSPGRKRSTKQATAQYVEADDSMGELARPARRVDQNGEDSSDELSQDAACTARTTAKHNSTGNSVQVPKTSSHPVHIRSGRSLRKSSQNPSPSSQLQREAQLQAPATQPHVTLQPQSSRDSIAVMDSQPDATAEYGTVLLPKSLRFPSSPSTNDYSINQTTMATRTGFTSDVISSSMPPMPPRLSDEAEEEEEVTPEGEERVPSSPPIITHEDLTYDEHEQPYDEYAEEGGATDSAESHQKVEDQEMGDDDDLPLTMPEPDQEDDENNGMQEGDTEDEGDLDLIQPQKVDFGTDQEVPETLEQDQPEDARLDEDDLPQSPDASVIAEQDEEVAAPQLPRLQRQNTVPETDALEETQPLLFAKNANATHDDQAHDLVSQSNGSGAPNQTASTEPFHTAPERTTTSQHNQPPPRSSKEQGSDTIQMGERLHSVQDIHNLPETQQSAYEEEIEMPKLSGLEETEEDNFMAPSSPAPPSAKRRKVTYTAKRKIFRSPAKPTVAVESRSEPVPSSPLSIVSSAHDEVSPAVATGEPNDFDTPAAEEDVQAPYTKQAILKSKPFSRPSKKKTLKEGSLKPVSVELLNALSSSPASPSRPSRASGNRVVPPVTPTKRRVRDHEAVAQADIDMPDVDEERDELAPTPEPVEKDTVVSTVSDSGESTTGDVIVPNRVFASWPGSHFYPATCLGRVAGRQLQIRFDDGNTTCLEATQVRALELRLGDHVKVDETGMKKHTYVVVGFKDKVDDLSGEDFPTTDRYGFTAVVLEEKVRESLPKSKAVNQGEHISVPMGSIYLTTQLWTRLRDRSFSFSPPTTPRKSQSRVNTPITAVDTVATPSFTRKGTAAPSLLKDATHRAASVASSTRSSCGTFSNMAFVLTSTAADVDKEGIANTIKTNGGQVLEEGFHELFDYESADAPLSSQSRRRSASVAEDTTVLTLKPLFKDLGFVALISDSFSRSTKYVQALALNVPCLHLRWIQDSLAASRAAPFAKYLLPAGVSRFLDPSGVVRSRTMAIYDPAADEVSFEQVVGERDLLLEGQTVLLITGKSKKEIEKRQPFIFLTHALGSSNVGRCADLSIAMAMLQDGQWDWVYVDNGEAGVTDAAAELFGTGKPAVSGKPKKSKKRKRDDTEEKEELVARGEVAGKKVKITCSEFVIQSLILGALVEE